MNNEEKNPKRHYVPVLPQPTKQQYENSVKGSRRFAKNQRRDRKLEEVLGSPEDLEGW